TSLITSLPPATQVLVSRWHCVQPRVPRAKPSERQVAPPRSSPSHSPPASTPPSPHSVAKVTVASALLAGVGRSRLTQSSRFTPVPGGGSRERLSGPARSGAPKGTLLPLNPP